MILRRINKKKILNVNFEHFLEIFSSKNLNKIFRRRVLKILLGMRSHSFERHQKSFALWKFLYQKQI